MGCLRQMNFSFKILWSYSHTFSRPPVVRAQALTAHITLSAGVSICSGQMISRLIRSFSSTLLFSACGVLGSPFHLPHSCCPCSLNTSLTHYMMFSLTISVFPNLIILLDRYRLLCLYNTFWTRLRNAWTAELQVWYHFHTTQHNATHSEPSFALL